jgi:hypothetical protein
MEAILGNSTNGKYRETQNKSFPNRKNPVRFDQEQETTRMHEALSIKQWRLLANSFHIGNCMFPLIIAVLSRDIPEIGLTQIR